MSECRTCLRPVVWVVTQAGKRMPLDPDAWHILPGPGTDLGVTPGGHVIRGTRLEQAGEGTREVRASHFATCPNADAHRRIQAAQRRSK